MRRFMLRAAVCAPALDGRSVLAEPPRWVVSDEDSTMVLFPTIHVLSEDVVWVTDDRLTALMNAREVWFELPQ